MTNPTPDKLLWSHRRDDGCEFRLSLRRFQGRRYFELATYAPETEGGRQLRFMNLRKSELRPLLAGLVAACKEEGISLRPNEAGAEGEAA